MEMRTGRSAAAPYRRTATGGWRLPMHWVNPSAGQRALLPRQGGPVPPKHPLGRATFGLPPRAEAGPGSAQPGAGTSGQGRGQAHRPQWAGSGAGPRQRFRGGSGARAAARYARRQPAPPGVGRAGTSCMDDRKDEKSRTRCATSEEGLKGRGKEKRKRKRSRSRSSSISSTSSSSTTSTSSSSSRSSSRSSSSSSRDSPKSKSKKKKKEKHNKKVIKH
ncbi:ADP-ribosylation factor-like protein 6-interacting protein 4 [Strigops habroptila]|uniref:ADP-ribosylation factor-like protein 6-interacting protein 4 n=1 Tax=Strigops habroptila TaxID=2489341 RepID=UPI0011CEFCA4|nr:ADP-ribosylation factor-like protein 6-interacting protein 4 [Strigops habroptila]